MTDEAPPHAAAAEAIDFLRRFSGMMSIGDNADRLLSAAFVIDDLTAEVRSTTAALEQQIRLHAQDTQELLDAQTELNDLRAQLESFDLRMAEQALQSQELLDNLVADKDAVEVRAERAEAALATVTQELAAAHHELAELKDNLAKTDTSVVTIPVSKLTLLRDQFKSLASEFRKKGDPASEVMCEIGLGIAQQALADKESAEDRPVPLVPAL